MNNNTVKLNQRKPPSQGLSLLAINNMKHGLPQTAGPKGSPDDKIRRVRKVADFADKKVSTVNCCFIS